jgi:hypothetical protein
MDPARVALPLFHAFILGSAGVLTPALALAAAASTAAPAGTVSASAATPPGTSALNFRTILFAAFMRSTVSSGMPVSCPP